ncbi:MAG: helix-turn-helix domain-containing protein [bacterium]
MLAEKLGISIPTVSRDVMALRERGHDIRAERSDGGWRFVLVGKSPNSGTQAHAVLAEERL